jgi:serine/threonine protein kinase
VVHPDDTTIALFVERRLGERQLTELKSHIDSCDSCRELVGQLARSDTVLAEGSTLGAPAKRKYLTRGDQVGRYVVQDLVGSGAMGAVYAALDTDLDRKVAIKVLHRSAAASHARMLREAQALARVADRGVVAVHDVGTYDDSIYIAMEFVTGGTFRTWFHDEPRTPRAIVTVALAAARGLAAAHDVGLVHRDVKPDNILVDARGVARIGDLASRRVSESRTRPAAPASSPPSSPRRARSSARRRTWRPSCSSGARRHTGAISSASA